MKLSYNWLADYIDHIPEPNELCDILTNTGLEVEGIHKIEQIRGGLAGVFTGHILDVENHTNADRLKVTKVDLGPLGIKQIVCGAPNVKVGQKVLVATVGCTLYPNPNDTFKIKESKIRGVISEGMICAEDELGLGTNHDGIMVLDNSIENGLPAAQLFNLDSDFQLEIGLTPNRNDAMCHIGVAKDIIAYNSFHKSNHSTIKIPNFNLSKNHSSKTLIEINIDKSTLVTRYAGVVIENIQVKESPDWLKNRLKSIDLNPINNVVDVTNYVMYEMGIPLHAFDSKIVDGSINVRKATENEVITTLDGVKRKLSSEDVVIANKNVPMCIGGVFGGIDSGVNSETKSIFLEAACFNQVLIRKTAKRHGLNTDASFRFERGVDPNQVLDSLHRASILIQEVTGGAIQMSPFDYYPVHVKPVKIPFRFDRCREIIGKQISDENIVDILTALEYEIKLTGKECEVSVPTYRIDVTREIDLIEEVLRIYGFNQVDLPSKMKISLPQVSNKSKQLEQAISELLVNNGFYEVMTNSLTSKEQSANIQNNSILSTQVELLNPLSNDLNILRQNLVLQQLEIIKYNQNRQNANLRLFEFGKIYAKRNSSSFNESKKLTLTITGKNNLEQWNLKPSEASFYTAKGILEAIFHRIGIVNQIKTQKLNSELLENGIEFNFKKQKIAEIGSINSQTRKKYGIKGNVHVIDIFWETILEIIQISAVRFSELPKTFSIRRDFSLLIDEQITFQEIIDVSKKVDKQLLKEINLFDVYEGDKLPQGKKSYAVSFSFQDSHETLKDEQIDGIMEKIRKALSAKLNAELR